MFSIAKLSLGENTVKDNQRRRNVCFFKINKFDSSMLKRKEMLSYSLAGPVRLTVNFEACCPLSVLHTGQSFLLVYL